MIAAGCSTVYTGVAGPDEIHFSSDPDGAEVSLPGEDETPSCHTPCALRLDRPHEQKVHATLDKLPEQTQVMEQRIAYTFWANAVFLTLSPIGAAIDWFDDSMWAYTKTEYHFNFKPEAAPKLEPGLEELPNTPELLRLKERYPEDYLTQQIGYYYGEQSPEEVHHIMIRLYRLMLDMMAAGDEPDVDEAVRQDHFSNLAKPQS